jgi:hypothetical protein
MRQMVKTGVSGNPETSKFGLLRNLIVPAEPRQVAVFEAIHSGFLSF